MSVADQLRAFEVTLQKPWVVSVSTYEFVRWRLRMWASLEEMCGSQRLVVQQAPHASDLDPWERGVYKHAAGLFTCDR